MALNNVPLAGQTLAFTRDPIAANFNQIDNAFTVDHYTYNSPAAVNGKHNKVSFPVVAAPAFAAGENGLYNALLGTNNELYTHIQTLNNTGTRDVPSTASILSTATPVGVSQGWTYLPSGLFIMWGTANLNGLTTVTLTNPPPTAMLHVQLTPYTPAAPGFTNASVKVIDILSNTQFRAYGALNDAAGAVGCLLLVIGY